MNEEQLFAAARKKPPNERAAFLSNACGDNLALRRDVEELLLADDQADSLLDNPVNAPAIATIGVTDITERAGTQIGPYKLREQIGEGGFGVVYVGEQQEPLARKVALKIIKPGMDTRDVIARFEAERQALALMEHPNVAKVLDAGATESGRPYFVMELVHGLPITDFCDEQKLTNRERLLLFVDVCRAVQHAHQRGIIHRDLKPSNILVTLDDDRPIPKVIDFGVSKALSRKLTDKTVYTAYGQMVGTPLYMAPEQAALTLHDVDTRSDVYSLGVLLYELLTGTTPFDKETLKEAGFDELRRIIREDEPPRPSDRISTLNAELLSTACDHRRIDRRTLGNSLRGELDWVVMRALEKDRNRRYESASAFVADVQRYLDDEPVQACPPSAWYRFRKFARRRKASFVAAAVVLAFVFTVAGGIGWVVGEKATRVREAELRAQVALDNTTDAIQKQDWAQAEVALARAESLANATEAGSNVRRRINGLRRDLEMVSAIDELRLLRFADDVRISISTKALNKEIDDAYAKAFRQYGVDIEDEGTDRLAAIVRASEIRDELITALDRWSGVRRSVDYTNQRYWHRPLDIAGLADRDDDRCEIRKLWRDWDLKRLEQLARSADANRMPVQSVHWISNALVRSEETRDLAIDLLMRSQLVHPEDFFLNFTLGTHLTTLEPPQFEEGLRFLMAARTLRPSSPRVMLSLAKTYAELEQLEEARVLFDKLILVQPASGYFQLGLAYGRRGKLDEAIAAYRKAIEVDPEKAAAHINLGNALQAQNKLEEAIACYAKAIEIEPKFVEAHNNLGAALAAQGKLDEAIVCFLKAIELDPEYASAHCNLGNCLHKQNGLDEAIACYRRAIELDPEYASAWNNLGNALKDQDKLDEAIACYRKAIELDPEYAFPHNGLGNALKDQDKLDEAVACYRKAIELEPNLAFPHNGLGSALRKQGKLDEAVACYLKAIELDPEYASAHCNLGNCLHKQNRLEEAIRCHRKALEIDPKYVAAHTSLGADLQMQDKLDEAIACYRKALEIDPKCVVAHYILGNALRKQGKLDEAVACYLKAIEIDPNCAPAHYNLGVAYQKQEKLEEAIACYQKAIETDPTSARAHRALGYVLLYDQGKLDEAIRCFRKAIELDPNHAAAHIDLGNALKAQGKPDQAIVCFRKALEIDPKYVAAHTNLGIVFSDQGKLDEAIRCFRKALEVDPNCVPAQCHLGNALGGQGKLEEAIRCFRKALEIDPKDVGAHTNLGIVFSDQGKLDEAIRCFRKALEVDPNCVLAHYNLGVAYRKQEKLDEAIACYRKALEIDPKCVNAHYILGHALRKQGKLDEAIKSFELAIDVKPDHVRAYVDLGGLLSNQMGEHAAAEKLFRTALGFQPDDAGALFSLAVVLGKQDRLDEAIACYRKAIEIDPKDVAAHTNLGIVFSDQGKLDEAIRCYRKALELDPKYAPAYNSLGVALCMQGELDAAIDAYSKAIEASPDGSGPYNNLGLALLAENRTSEATVAFENAVALFGRLARENPGDSIAKRNLTAALTNLATSHLALGNNEAHQKACQSLVALFPPPAERTTADWGNVGQALYRAGQYAEARVALEKVIDLRRDEGPSLQSGPRWWYLAMTLAQLGEAERAREIYEQLDRQVGPAKPLSEATRRLRTETAEVLGIEMNND